MQISPSHYTVTTTGNKCNMPLVVTMHFGDDKSWSEMRQPKR